MSWPCRISSWAFASTSGVGLSVGIPDLPSLSGARLTLPMGRFEVGKSDPVELVNLSGLGFGVGWSMSLDAFQGVRFLSSAGGSFSTAGTPGSGSHVMVSASKADPIAASFFEGRCLVLSADLFFGHLDKGSSVVIILDSWQLRWPNVIPGLPKAAGLVEGLSFGNTLAGAQVGVQIFSLSLPVEPIPAIPWSPETDPTPYQNALGSTFMR